MISEFRFKGPQMSIQFCGQSESTQSEINLKSDFFNLKSQLRYWAVNDAIKS
jgi:hypothetical protein